MSVEPQSSLFKHIREAVGVVATTLGRSIDFHADTNKVTYPSVTLIPIAEQGFDRGLHREYDKYMLNIYVSDSDTHFAREVRKALMTELGIKISNGLYHTYVPLLDYSNPSPQTVGRGRLDLESREGFERKPTGESSERRYGAVFKFFYDL